MRDQKAQNRVLQTRDDAQAKINPAPIANKRTALVRSKMSGRFNQFKIGIIIKKMSANLLLDKYKLPIYVKCCLLSHMN